MKDIKGFEGIYTISEDGEIFRHGKRRKTYFTKNGYEMVDLSKNNKRYKFLVHRLVAEHYCYKPEGCDVVHHKDNNRQNNHASNLEWTTQKENIHRSYKTMSPVRNFRRCKLFVSDKCVGEFQSINECCRYANKKYGVSYSSLNKYRKIDNLKIVKV